MNAPTTHANPARLLREQIRAGRHTTVTTGMAPGHVQANLVILPADWAEEFAVVLRGEPQALSLDRAERAWRSRLAGPGPRHRRPP